MHLLRPALTLILVFSGVTTLLQAANPVDYLVLGESVEQIRAKIAVADCDVVDTIPQLGIVVVRSDDSGFLSDAAKIDGVKVVPDVEVQWTDPAPGLDFSEEDLIDVEPDSEPPANDPDDAFAPLQWGLDAIDAPEAWATGARGQGVRVAVLDSGIDILHPDIEPNINASASASFVPGEPFFRTRPGFSHGTHVAGIIAAADNALGTVGVAPDAEIIGVKVLRDRTGSGAFSWILQGIVHAAEQDADIINMSLGGRFARRGAFFDPGTPDDKSDDIRTTPFIVHQLAAFNRATSLANNQGTLIIASAGNTGTDGEADKDLLALPRDAAHVVSISATAPEGWAEDFDATDTPASYTDVGKSVVDLAGPGGDFDHDNDDPCDVLFVRVPCFVYDGVLSSGGYRRFQGNTRPIWSWASGTSMAAPHVSGVAALIIGQSESKLTPAQVLATLQQGAEDFGKPGKDDFFGHGRVNALGSVVLGQP